MKISIFFISYILLVLSCKPTPPLISDKSVTIDSLKQNLLETDLTFSALSKVKGRNAAFLQYMDEHVTMLRPNGMPMVGKDTMEKVFALRPDTGYTLTWKPLFADVSQSGDIGYTYGTYLVTSGKNDSSQGTYCSIWKRDSLGDWKFVLDTGNEGLKTEAKK